MIKNEDTYCMVQHKIVREIGVCEAVVYGTIQGLLRKKGGYGGVSNQTIMDMCGMNRKSLSRYIDKLIQAGYIEKVSGDGRGNVSIYYISKKGDKMTTFSEEKGGQNDPKRGTNLPIKGDKMTTFSEEKGGQNDPKRGTNLPIKGDKMTTFSEEKGGQNDPKRGTNLPIKGDKMTTINKGENKEINKESGGDMRAYAQSPTPFDTTPLNFENMEDFNLFWSLYPGDPDWSNERENCERVWYAMQQNWRDNLIQQLQNGKRWRVRENDNPYWYLKNYNGEVVRAELPIIRQGTAACTKWLNESIRDGKRVCVMLMGEGADTHSVFCLDQDRKECEDAGLRFVRYY